jgi:hypothetical protein
VYHERTDPDRRRCQEIIEASVQPGLYRQRVQTMQKTAAEFLRDKGRQEGRREGETKGLRQALLWQLRCRFGELPDGTVKASGRK